jgi:hypothetical protein
MRQPDAPAVTTRWTDPFLDTLRGQGDPEADEALLMMLGDNEALGLNALFAHMDVNDEVPPSTHFPVLSGFFKSTERLPADVDLRRITRGEKVFEDHAFSGALVLLTKSLPEGYQAPNLAIVLNVSGDLRTHTYRRLLGTLQAVVNVSTCHGFQHGGRAVITAQKLRLLHAGVRHLTRKYRPEYSETYGVPVNLEDMLGTVLGFSLLVIQGWRTLGAGLTRAEEEDFLYLWMVFARLAGIHPPGRPESGEYVPDDVADATALYERYKQRHYVDGSLNPDGLALAEANLRMLTSIIPWPLRLIGFGSLPALCMHHLMGDEPCLRLRVRFTRGTPLIVSTLLFVHRLLTVFGPVHLPDHEHLGMIFFQKLITRSYGGRITYSIPTDAADLRAMVEKKVPHPHP